MFALILFPLAVSAGFNPDKNREPPCPGNGSNPIHSGTGWKIQREVDYVGPSSSLLRFERTYNSSGGAISWGLGPNWRHNYDRQLVRSSDGLQVGYTSASGNQTTFVYEGGAYRPSSIHEDSQIKLTQPPWDQATQSYPYEFQLPDGSTEYFEYFYDHWRLHKIQDREGRSLLFRYEDQPFNPFFRLLREVEDQSGRKIAFEYESGLNTVYQPRLKKITAPGGYETTLKWEFLQGYILLTRADRFAASANPTSFREYRYGETDGGAFQAAPYLMTSILDERASAAVPQRISNSWRYKVPSQNFSSIPFVAVLSTHGDVNAMTDRVELTFPQLTFQSTAKQWIAAGTSTTRTYRFAHSELVLRPETISAICPTCSSGCAASSTYTDEGYPLTKTAFNGSQTTFEYTRFPAAPATLDVMLEYKRTESANFPNTKRITETTWDSSLRLPLTRTVKNAAGSASTADQWIYATSGPDLQPVIKGQVAVHCEIDRQIARSFECSPNPLATPGVRVTRYQYCTPADVLAQNTCPTLGALKSIDGPRTDVADITTFEYYPSQTVNNGASACYALGSCRQGDLRKVTIALGQVTEYLAYNAHGRAVHIKDANGVSTEMDYHPRGWLLALRVYAGSSCGSTCATTAYEYDSGLNQVGNVTKITRADGVYSAFEYDDANRLRKVTDNLGNSITYTLNFVGQKIGEQVKDPAGTLKRALAREYNALGQLKKTFDAQNRATETWYDTEGNERYSRDARGVHTSHEYDPLNRLKASIQDRHGSTLAGVADVPEPAQVGNGTTDGVSGTGPSSSCISGENCTRDARTEFAYDERNNLVSVKDPNGLTTSYVYDGLDNLVQLNSPDTGTTAYQHDAAGNPTRQTDMRGVVSDMTYDALNRLRTVTYTVPPASAGTINDPGDISYSYDERDRDTGCSASFPIGRMTRMTDPSGSTTFCYDERGNVTRRTQLTNVAAGGVISMVVAHTFNLADRLMSITYPSGATIDYQRNSINQINGVTMLRAGRTSTLVSLATYLPFGPTISLSYGNGMVQSRTFNSNYWPREVIGPGYVAHYDHDAVGNIVGNYIDPPGRQGTTYQYDDLYRLTTADYCDDTLFECMESPYIGEWRYDRTGNRTQHRTANTVGFTTFAYELGRHRIDSITEPAGLRDRTSDANGNTLSYFPIGVSTAQTMKFDARNRMNEITPVAGQTWEYTFNASGERVRKRQTLGGTGVRYLIYSCPQLLGDYNQNGPGANGMREIVWLDDMPIAILSHPGSPQAGAVNDLSFIVSDHLNTPRALIRPTITNRTTTQHYDGQTMVWFWDVHRGAFGENAANEDPDLDGITYNFPLRFSGQFRDAESNLNYNYFRDFEAGTGRYLESDPIGLWGGINGFSYVRSPTGFVDPWGLSECQPDTEKRQM